MLEESLKDIWKNSAQAERIRFDMSRLMIDLNRKLSKIEKAIRNRDIREIGASVIGILLFGYFAYTIPFPITQIASVLGVVWFAYVIYKFKQVQKFQQSVDLSLSFRAQLVNQREHMVQQASLLDSVLYWYVLPPFVLNIGFIMGLGNPVGLNWAPEIIELLPVTLNQKLIMLTGLAIIYALIVWLNKRAVRKTLKPLIRDIERVLHQLESEE